jgi:hypothetical protein
MAGCPHLAKLRLRHGGLRRSVKLPWSQHWSVHSRPAAEFLGVHPEVDLRFRCLSPRLRAERLAPKE